jgi:hypothetical protein
VGGRLFTDTNLSRNPKPPVNIAVLEKKYLRGEWNLQEKKWKNHQFSGARTSDCLGCPNGPDAGIAHLSGLAEPVFPAKERALLGNLTVERGKISTEWRKVPCPCGFGRYTFHTSRDV